MSSKRVLVLNHFAVPREQPGGTRHVELFSRVADWDFMIIASRRNLSTGARQADSPHFNFVPVLPYRGNGVARVLNWCSYAFMALLAGLREPRPHVVYASSPHLLTGLTGWLLARIRRSRFVLEIRDLWPRTLVDMGHLTRSSTIYRVLRALELFLYRHADTIVTMAPGTSSALIADGVPDGKITYIPNGADPADFEPSADRGTLRRRYGFDRLTCLYAGAHGPANGLDLLLDAASQVQDCSLDIVLVGDGVAKRALHAEAERRGISNVRFIDAVPKTQIADLLGAADIGLHVLADVELFRSAVSPNKLFDYLAAGKYVISNCPGFVAEIISDGHAGQCTEPSGLAEALRTAATMSLDKIRTSGADGRAWAAAHTSRTASAEALRAILNDVVLDSLGQRPHARASTC